MDDGLSPIDRIKRKARSSDIRTEKLIGYEDTSSLKTRAVLGLACQGNAQF